MSTPIIVALITGAFAVVVALIQSSRRENKRDHGIVADSLRQINTSIHTVGKKIDGHINWHAEGGAHGRSSRTDSE